MQSRVADIQEVEKIFEREEAEAREQLKIIETQRGVTNSPQLSGTRNLLKSMIPMNSDAKSRNSNLLKDLEISKARLRTLTSFSPTEQELRQHILAYRATLTRRDC